MKQVSHLKLKICLHFNSGIHVFFFYVSCVTTPSIFLLPCRGLYAVTFLNVLTVQVVLCVGSMEAGSEVLDEVWNVCCGQSVGGKASHCYQCKGHMLTFSWREYGGCTFSCLVSSSAWLHFMSFCFALCFCEFFSYCNQVSWGVPCSVLFLIISSSLLM